jgi:large subunit ribosomal protein L25
VGESPGVKEGGALTLVLREVNVEALPMEVPDRLELDISDMTIGDSLRVADIAVPEGVQLLDDPDSVVATVTPPTKVEEPEVEEEEEELLEGEEAVEGEAEGEAATEAADESESGGEDSAES